MIDIQQIFGELTQQESFKRIRDVDSPISVFCGIREVNLPSIAFMTDNPPVLIESTQCIKVSQWEERDKTYWSRFDLQNSNARTIFYSLCLDLIQSTYGSKDSTEAIQNVKNRFTVWRKMFKKAPSPMSIEEYQGLFGELYFLYYILSKKIGLEKAIKSWSGANRTAKDFSIEEDWYEIKTITTGTSEIKISSLTQLESEVEGRLVAVRVERMSESYDDGHATVEAIIKSVIDENIDLSIKDDFLSKVMAYGYSAEMDLSAFPRFSVKTVDSYIVSGDFPRLTTKDITYDEISKVTYNLSISGIKKFMEVKDDYN